MDNVEILPASLMVEAAIQESLHNEDERYGLVKFIVVAQYVDFETGDMNVSGLSTPGLFEWEIKGLLEHSRDHLEFFIPALAPEFEQEEDDE